MAKEVPEEVIKRAMLIAHAGATQAISHQLQDLLSSRTSINNAINPIENIGLGDSIGRYGTGLNSRSLILSTIMYLHVP